MRHTAEITFGANTRFVATDLHAKYLEIVLGPNIGFVATDLHAKNCRSRIGNEHKQEKSQVGIEFHVKVQL